MSSQNWLMMIQCTTDNGVTFCDDYGNTTKIQRIVLPSKMEAVARAIAFIRILRSMHNRKAAVDIDSVKLSDDGKWVSVSHKGVRFCKDIEIYLNELPMARIELRFSFETSEIIYVMSLDKL